MEEKEGAMSIDWSIVFGLIALGSTGLNAFFAIRTNPLANEINLLKQENDAFKKRCDALELANNKSQENNVKLAVIEERQKTSDIKMDRIEGKVDKLLENAVNS